MVLLSHFIGVSQGPTVPPVLICYYHIIVSIYLFIACNTTIHEQSNWHYRDKWHFCSHGDDVIEIGMILLWAALNL